MKEDELFHIPPRDAQEHSYERYEREITFLKQQISKISDELQAVETQEFRVEDEFETDLERLAYFTSILNIQYVILQKCLKVEVVKPLNIDFMRVGEDDGQLAFKQLKVQIKEIIRKAQESFADMGIDEENSDDKNLRNKEFINNITEQGMKIVEMPAITEINLPEIVLHLQGVVLEFLKANWPLREGKAGIINEIAREQASSASKEVSDQLVKLRGLQRESRDMEAQTGSADNQKLLEEVIKMRNALGEREDAVEFEYPVYLQKIMGLELPEKQVIERKCEYASIIEKLGTLGKFRVSEADMDRAKDSEVVVNTELLKRFNEQASVALAAYQQIHSMISKGLEDADVACDAIDAAEQFKLPSMPEAPSSGIVQLKELDEIVDIQEQTALTQDLIKMVESETNSLVDALNSEEEVELAAYESNLCANIKKLTSKIQKLENNIEENTENAARNSATATLEIQKLNASFVRMCQIGGDNASQVYLEVKRNFCQICKMQPVRSMLPCGHLFCSKCIRDRPGRKQFCPKCTNEYQENQIVQLSKELIV